MPVPKASTLQGPNKLPASQREECARQPSPHTFEPATLVNSSSQDRLSFELRNWNKNLTNFRHSFENLDEHVWKCPAYCSLTFSGISGWSDFTKSAALAMKWRLGHWSFLHQWPRTRCPCATGGQGECHGKGCDVVFHTIKLSHTHQISDKNDEKWQKIWDFCYNTEHWWDMQVPTARVLEETDHFQARGDQVGIHQFHTLDHFGSHLGHIWVIFLPKCEPCRAVSCFRSWRSPTSTPLSFSTFRGGHGRQGVTCDGRPWRPWVIPSLTECRVWGFHSTCCDQFLSLRLSTSTSFHFPSLSITFHHFPLAATSST